MSTEDPDVCRWCNCECARQLRVRYTHSMGHTFKTAYHSKMRTIYTNKMHINISQERLQCTTVPNARIKVQLRNIGVVFLAFPEDPRVSLKKCFSSRDQCSVSTGRNKYTNTNPQKYIPSIQYSQLQNAQLQPKLCAASYRVHRYLQNQQPRNSYPHEKTSQRSPTNHPPYIIRRLYRDNAVRMPVVNLLR
jgi:hypothetical protein